MILFLILKLKKVILFEFNNFLILIYFVTDSGVVS